MSRRLLASAAARGEWLDQMAARGLRVAALNVWGNPLHPDAAVARQHDRDLRDSIRLAALLGVDRIVAMAGCPAADGGLTPHFAGGGWLPYLEGVTGLGMGTLEYGEGGASFFLGKRVPLAALSLEEASLAKAQASRAAPRKAGAFPCPACGGSLALRSGKEAEAIVCEYCDTLVDLSEGKHKALAKVLKAGPTLEGLRVGLKGTLRGAEWEVVGRLRYRDVSPPDW